MDLAVWFLLFSSQRTPQTYVGSASTVNTETGLYSGGKDPNWGQKDLWGK